MAWFDIVGVVASILEILGVLYAMIGILMPDTRILYLHQSLTQASDYLQEIVEEGSLEEAPDLLDRLEQ